MRPKSMILLVLALGCGLVASIGISQVMNRSHDGGPAVEKEPILVAMNNIKVGELLGEKNLKSEEWPKEKIPPDACRQLKEVEGKRAGGVILAGEPIRQAKFAIDNRIAEIPNGFRVATLNASDASTAAGNLLQPGDRVDVLFVREHGAATQVAKTILQNVRVFAVNEQWRQAEGDKSNETISARTISLLLKPGQAEIIALAQSLGKIRLVLRNPNDERVAETAGVGEDQILNNNFKNDSDTEAGGAPSDKSGNVAGILDWLKNQQHPATPVASVDPEERFKMEVLSGGDRKDVEFTRRGKDARWSGPNSGENAPSGTSGASRPAISTGDSAPARPAGTEPAY